MNTSSEIIICEKCQKPTSLCVCTDDKALNNKHFVLILQHPQEQDKNLGTASIITTTLENAQLEIALSRPSLQSIVKRPVDAKRWGVLYLGAQKNTPKRSGLYALDKKGLVLEDSSRVLKNLDGIILLDGSWSQAKALWWRNAWLLKTQRLLLVPEKKSLYGKLRKEPRAESISTLEATAHCLSALGEDPQIAQTLIDRFQILLEKYKTFNK